MGERLVVIAEGYRLVSGLARVESESAYEFAYEASEGKFGTYWLVADAEGRSDITGPYFDDVGDAITWGRQRAPYVYVNVITDKHADDDEEPEQQFEAGELCDETADIPRWPTHIATVGQREPETERRYGGYVHVTEQWTPERRIGTRMYSGQLLEYNPHQQVEKFTELDATVIEQVDGVRLSEALEWARARAQRIIVRRVMFGPGYWNFTAGTLDPPGRSLSPFQGWAAGG